MSNFIKIKIGSFLGAVLQIKDEMTIESNEFLVNEIDKIAKDKSLKFLILEINSLGGDAEGVFELAKKIRDLKILTLSYVMQNALSGAYWVASAANIIYLKDELCAVGSVGVYSTFVENSQQLKSNGLTLEVIKKGKLKAETTGFLPLTAVGRAQLQEKVDIIYAVFSEFVNNCRKNIEKNYLQGQPHYGKKAIQRNFADYICSPEEAQIRILKLLKGV